MMEEFEIPIFTSTVLCEVAGYEPVTFRAHRNRLGLFAHTRMTADEGGRGQRTTFSFLELCAARMVVLLTRQGMPAERAVWFADGPARSMMAMILRQTTDTRFVAVRLAYGEDDVPEYVFRAETATIASLFVERVTPTTVIDFWEVARHVQACVNALPGGDNLHGDFTFQIGGRK